MIIHTNANIDEIHQQGKNYKWARISCSKCNEKCWGHGHVQRYFNIRGLSDSIECFLKRWRCSKCGCVHICIPSSHWRRFQSSIKDVYDALVDRVQTLKWPPWVSRQRGGHWLRSIITKAQANLLMKENVLETILSFKLKSLAIF